MIAQTLLRWNYGSASVLEMAWTLLGLLGMVFALQLLFLRLGDLQALKRSAHFVAKGARHLLALQNIRNQSERVALLACILVIGVAGLLSTPPKAVAGPSPYAVVIAAALIVMVLILVGGGFWDKQVQGELYFQVRLRRADDLPPEIAPVKEKPV